MRREHVIRELEQLEMDVDDLDDADIGDILDAATLGLGNNASDFWWSLARESRHTKN